VIGFLRFVGVVMTAVWFGASSFFTFFVGPAFFSMKMLDMLGVANVQSSRAYVGAAAQIVINRYFVLH